MSKSLSEKMTAHQIGLQRLAGGEIKQFETLLKSLSKQIESLIGGELTPDAAFRLSSLERELNELIGTTTGKLQTQLSALTQELSDYEVEYTSKLLNGFMTVKTAGVSNEILLASVTRNPMVLVSNGKTQRLTIQQAVDVFTDAAQKEVVSALRTGVVSGKTSQQIARDVSNLVTTRTRAQAHTLVRTTTNHIASTAREEIYRANAELFKGERWVATLDGKTRIEHMALDGKEFALGEGPKTPFGYNCRCLRVAVIKDELRIPGFEVQRASKDGPVSGRLTYDGFLRKQSKEFQDEVLGPSRAKIFRGGTPIARFTDDAGRTLSLKQLKAMDETFNL